MKACTLGIGTGPKRNTFRKDMRGRDRPRFSQRIKPAGGPLRLKAGPSRFIYDSEGNRVWEKRGHFTTAELKAINAKRARK